MKVIHDDLRIDASVAIIHDHGQHADQSGGPANGVLMVEICVCIKLGDFAVIRKFKFVYIIAVIDSADPLTRVQCGGEKSNVSCKGRVGRVEAKSFKIEL